MYSESPQRIFKWRDHGPNKGQSVGQNISDAKFTKKCFSVLHRVPNINLNSHYIAGKYFKSQSSIYTYFSLEGEILQTPKIVFSGNRSPEC